MKRTLKAISQTKKEIELEIPADEVTSEFETILTQFAGKAKIRGFRPGKAPREIVKQKYYPNIKESLLNALVPKALNNELKAQNLNVIGMPVLNDLDFQEGQPLRVKAQVEVWPDFKLPPYKNIKVKKKKIQVTAEEINQSLEQLRQRSAEYVPVEGRGVVDGDYVIVKMQGKILKTNKIIPEEKVVIQAGHPENEELLNKNLIGLKPADETKCVLNHDNTLPDKKLAGKKVEYNIRVVSIKEKIIPDINDSFAKDLGEYKNLKEIKEKIKEEIHTSKEKETKKEMGENIIKNISNKLDIEFPESLMQQEYLAVMRGLLTSQSQKDLNNEELDKLKTEGRRKAEENIKNHLILKKIAEKESLEVSEREIQEEFKAIAKANNLPLSQVIDYINKEGKREELKNNLLLKKTVDFLVEHAIIE